MEILGKFIDEFALEIRREKIQILFFTLGERINMNILKSLIK